MREIKLRYCVRLLILQAANRPVLRARGAEHRIDRLPTQREIGNHQARRAILADRLENNPGRYVRLKVELFRLQAKIAVRERGTA